MAKLEYLNPNHGNNRSKEYPIEKVRERFERPGVPKLTPEEWEKRKDEAYNNIHRENFLRGLIYYAEYDLKDLFRQMTKEVAMYKLIEYYRRNGRHELKRAFIDAIDEVLGKEM